jgi:hypothetical protein
VGTSKAPVTLVRPAAARAAMRIRFLVFIVYLVRRITGA